MTDEAERDDGSRVLQQLLDKYKASTIHLVKARNEKEQAKELAEKERAEQQLQRAQQAQIEAKQNFRSELFSFADKDNDTMAGSSAASAVTNQHLANMSRLPAVEAHSNLQTPAQVAPQLGYLPPIQQPSYSA